MSSQPLATPEEIAKAYGETGRWLMDWQADRLASIESRGSSMIAVASLLAALGPPVITAATSDGRIASASRMLALLGLALAAISIVWTLLHVMRVEGEIAAPNTPKTLASWTQIQTEPEGYSLASIHTALAGAILTGTDTEASVLHRYKAMVDERADHRQKALWPLLAAVGAFVVASALVPFSN